MEILLARSFLESARRDPEAVLAAVAHLAGQRPTLPDFGGTRVDATRVLHWKRQSDRLELLSLVEETSHGLDHPLADLSQSELRALGVDDTTTGRVQLVRDLGELEAIPLDEPVRARLRFRLLQKRAVQASALERRAESLGHLELYLRGDIAELLLNLDGAQRPIVELAATGPIIVRGVAGSGKTAVALHRIHALVSRGSSLTPPRILYLTFNRALAAATTELLHALGLPHSSVEVRNIHRWCREFLGGAAPRVLIQGDTRAQLIAKACQAVRTDHPGSKIWKYPLSFFADEIHRIKGRVLGGLNEYLSMQRFGAGRPLDARVRQIVWDVHEAYRALCAERRVSDWDDLPRLALDRIGQLPGALPTYDHVFVDEGQDFTPIGLRLASKLSGTSQNVMVSFDPAQSIYEKGFRWRSCGITAHGSRSFTLEKNHRNAIQILDFARPLLDAIRQDPLETEGGGDEDLLSPLATARSSRVPQVLAAPPRQDAAYLAELVRAQLEHEALPPRNIAVLCFKAHRRQHVADALTRAGVLCQVHDATADLRLTDPSVKVMTMHSAKGLEFPVVYLLASGRDVKVPKSITDPDDRRAFIARARKVLYMAMTRALTHLTLVHDSAEGSPLDALLAP